MTPLRNRELLALLRHPAVEPGDLVVMSGDSLGTVATLLADGDEMTEAELDSPFLSGNTAFTAHVWRAGVAIPIRMSDPLR